MVTKVKVDISPDKLIARLTIDEDGVKFPTADEIISFLTESGVVFGVDRELIRKIAEQRKPVQDVICARGGLPDEDAIDWKVDVSRLRMRQLRDSERADFKRPHLFIPVKKDQVLAVYSGGDIKTVTGEVLPGNKKESLFRAGGNTHLSPDGMTLYADLDGSLYLENGLFHVDKVYHVHGDVNYGTGNIKFDGPVIIDGDVRSGFRVEATESIFIAGNVEAASIYSHKGDITVQYGIVGKNKAKILAGGNLVCGFIQDATVGVRKDVTVQHYLINAVVVAGGKVDVSQNEGLIRGGSITADMGIVAKDVGSYRNARTELKLRHHSENEYQSKLWELSRLRSELMIRLSSLEKKYSFLSVIEQRTGKLSPEKKAEQEFLSKELKRLKDRIEEYHRQELELQKEASKQRMAKEIIILNNLYPNVDIDINGQGFVTDELLTGVKIFRFKDEIIVESLRGLDDRSYDIFVPARNQTT